MKSIENEAAALIEKLQEAERQAEMRRQEWLAEEERRRQEEDRRREAQSIKDSYAERCVFDQLRAAFSGPDQSGWFAMHSLKRSSVASLRSHRAASWR